MKKKTLFTFLLAIVVALGFSSCVVAYRPYHPYHHHHGYYRY